jgi:hypothetical protein
VLLELERQDDDVFAWAKRHVTFQLFFPEGIAFDGNRFNRTAATAPLFNDLAPSESADEKMVTLTFASWNQIAGWLGRLAALRTLREAA